MDFLNFLFGTGQGVLILCVGGMALFLVIAFFAERKTHRMYYNHPEVSEEEEEWADDWDDWDDDEDEKDAK